MELSSHVRQDFSPRTSPISCAAAGHSVSVGSIAFSPRRCSPLPTSSRSAIHRPRRVRASGAQRTLLFPLWHPRPPSTMPCCPRLQFSMSCSCRSASSSTCVHGALPHGADGSASSPSASRAPRPPACNHCCRPKPSPLSTATTTLRSAYQPAHPSIFAVRVGNALQFRLAEFENNRLILRPLELEAPVQLLVLGPHEAPSDIITGRVCLILAPIP